MDSTVDVIETGMYNDSGQLSNRKLSTFRTYDVPVYRIDFEGTVEITSNGATYLVYLEVRARLRTGMIINTGSMDGML